jgi:lipopolysaccharide export system protein LptA
VSTPVSVVAQDGCEGGDQGNDLVNIQTIPGVGQVTYITRPHFVCEGGVQIWADSAVAYQDEGVSHLIGAVRYLEAGRELLADEARYFSNLGRLQAQGHLSVRDEAQGLSIENGALVYLRRTEFREEETMTVVTGTDGVRPKAILTPPPDSTNLDADPGEPYTVVGDRIFLSGSSYFTSAGTVEIVRDGLLAYADSAEFDQAEGDLLLEGSARVEGDAYDLEGRTITMVSPHAATSEIQALRDARLASEDILLTSARIVVFLRNDELERLVATSMDFDDGAPPDSTEATRPEATVESFVLTADSLEVTAPAQSVERVFAAGTARSVSTSRDSLNVDLLPDIARTDWLEGDTVIVTFRPNESGDAGENLTVETIVARVGARSLYRLEPSDSTARAGEEPPAVHYVTGDQITIEMDEGGVQGMQVMGQTQGFHLEPLPPPSAPADSTSVVDTTATRDTLFNAPADPTIKGSSEDPPRQPTGDQLSQTPDAPRKERTWTHV